MSAAPQEATARALAVVPANEGRDVEPSRAATYTREQIELLKRTVAKGTTDDEFALFIEVAKRTCLDPFTKQIHAVTRDSQFSGRTVTFQTGIDGYRLIAERSGEYEGQTTPLFCGPDGVWKDVWLDAEPPRAAKVGIYRKGWREPVYGIALWSEYVQVTRDKRTGELKANRMWQQFGTVMLAKCAESLALRKAFPRDLSGIYTHEEMSQASGGATAAEPEPSAEDIAAKERAFALALTRDTPLDFGKAWHGKTLAQMSSKEVAWGLEAVKEGERPHIPARWRAAFFAERAVREQFDSLTHKELNEQPGVMRAFLAELAINVDVLYPVEAVEVEVVVDTAGDDVPANGL